ncbi:MAG: hypothetical protein HQK72_02100 [Desulfamplus sp.]|nr:hypothetical protein [Desulfamplus sp.]
MEFSGCNFCLPVFFHQYFLVDGHTEKTNNATLTFFKYNNRRYMVTCLHVIDILDEKRDKTNDYWHTLSLSLGRTFLQLSDMDHSDPTKRKDVFRKITENFGEEQVDIVIAPIDDIRWSWIQSEKLKQTIDLDNWIAPKWADMDMGSVFGYPTKHKSQKGDYVASPCVTIFAEIVSNLNENSNQITLFSTLEKPHGYYFSGISGGPIFVSSDEDRRYPIGIVYEGQPGSPKDLTTEESEQSIFSENDILIKGFVLTPDIFSTWIERAGL